jgi:hypothetical protein
MNKEDQLGLAIIAVGVGALGLLYLVKKSPSAPVSVAISSAVTSATSPATTQAISNQAGLNSPSEAASGSNDPGLAVPVMGSNSPVLVSRPVRVVTAPVLLNDLRKRIPVASALQKVDL